MLRVLVIDDEKLFLRSVARLMSRDTRFYCTFCLPDEALRKVTSGIKFDLVLSDVMMGQFNGPSLKEQILAIDPSLAPRYLFMSGYIDPDVLPGLHGANVLDKINIFQTLIPRLESFYH